MSIPFRSNNVQRILAFNVQYKRINTNASYKYTIQAQSLSVSLSCASPLHSVHFIVPRFIIIQYNSIRQRNLIGFVHYISYLVMKLDRVTQIRKLIESEDTFMT